MANVDKDPKLTRRQADNVRAYIAGRAHDVAKALLDHGMGMREMAPSQVKALQVVLDRVLPSMQSIDQTTHTDQPELTPAELDAMLGQAVRELARKDPDRLQALLEAPQLRVVSNGV